MYRRNQDVRHILAKATKTIGHPAMREVECLNRFTCFWCGDLNYRINHARNEAISPPSSADCISY